MLAPEIPPNARAALFPRSQEIWSARFWIGQSWPTVLELLLIQCENGEPSVPNIGKIIPPGLVRRATPAARREHKSTIDKPLRATDEGFPRLLRWRNRRNNAISPIGQIERPRRQARPGRREPR